ncbi:MAG TPA: penicillin-binding transpeptidase domain-containing protein [Acidimicrobiales bacterium]|nr:penicillin-binding transpeptidase domain-containing protein [Acidimicrobiales bacterium]
MGVLRRRAVVIAVVAVVVAGAAGAGWILLNRKPALPSGEVAAYLDAWERFDVEAMQRLTDAPPPEMDETVSAMRDDLRITAARLQRTGLRRQGEGAIASYAAEVDVAGLGAWTYTGTLEFRRLDGKWRLVWSPAALHPELGAGERFGRTRAWPVRAPITGVDGAALVAAGDVVDIGLQPDRIRDLAQVQTILRQQVGVEPAAVTAALNAPGVRPDHFVAVARIRPDRFAQVRPVLEPVPGIFFQRTTGRLPVAENFALHVLGRYDEVTAERLEELGAPYLVGDRVGLSGLERAFERQLAGTPSGEVRTVTATDEPVRTLFSFTGTPPKPVGTTLDRRTQEAAEQALAGVTFPAALVAVDAGTGDVRAVVSRPFDQPFNRALAGQYPPGSTFKVVTTAALLGAGTRPETAVGCPTEATVGGQGFRNFEGGSLGGTTFRTAFAQSCNTAFVTLSANLADAALTAAAATFGFGADYDLGLPTEGATFPAPRDVAERASQAIGQGRVEASPLHMATVAGAVASGGWRAPRLLTDKAQAPTTLLDPATAATLKELTAEVVRTGTGTAAAVAGQQVGGKTGTAEIGGPDPNRTHAWFIGYRGSLAFAILAEGGGVGGRVAAPLAARFLAAAP